MYASIAGRSLREIRARWLHTFKTTRRDRSCAKSVARRFRVPKIDPYTQGFIRWVAQRHTLELFRAEQTSTSRLHPGAQYVYKKELQCVIHVGRPSRTLGYSKSTLGSTWPSLFRAVSARNPSRGRITLPSICALILENSPSRARRVERRLRPQATLQRTFARTLAKNPTCAKRVGEHSRRSAHLACIFECTLVKNPMFVVSVAGHLLCRIICRGTKELRTVSYAQRSPRCGLEE